MNRLHFWVLGLCVVAIFLASDLTDGNRMIDSGKSKIFNVLVRAWSEYEAMERSEQEADLQEFMRDFDQKVEWINKNSHRANSETNVPNQDCR